MIFEVFQAMVLGGIVIAAAVAMKSKNLVVSVVLMCAMSLFLAVEFYVLHAPDVAIAEAAIGAGISTAVYIIAINKTRGWENEEEN